MSSNVTFITGNQSKADYLSNFIGHQIDHIKLNLDEIQSTNLKEIAEHKVRQAYEVLKQPVVIEDVALEFHALGNLPGPFIKFFVDQMPLDVICSMIPVGSTRKATARCVIAYFDGSELQLFESSLDGQIAFQPAGNNGFGWDKIFIPHNHTVTKASLSDTEYQKTYLQIKPLEDLKKFILSKK